MPTPTDPTPPTDGDQDRGRSTVGRRTDRGRGSTAPGGRTTPASSGAPAAPPPGGLGATAGDPAQDYATPGAESTRATDLVDRHMAGQANEGITVVWKDDRGADAAAVRERIDPFLQRAAPGSSWAASRSPTPRRAAAPRPRA